MKRKSAFFCVSMGSVLAALFLLFCGPHDFANQSAIAAAYNFRATTNVNEGDVVVWDNRCVLHRARPYDHGEPRVMLHTRIKGDPATESGLAE